MESRVNFTIKIKTLIKFIFSNTEKSILMACKYRKIDPNLQNIEVLGAKSGLKKSIFLRKTP